MINFRLHTTLAIILLVSSKAFSQDKISPITTYAARQQPAALAKLMEDAKLALALPNLSVTNNAPVPPGGSRHDFYSWSPYSWPNPATANGLPYITKDGQTNPETEAKSDKPLLRRMAVGVQTLALAYHFSSDKKYADKAATLLRTWFLDTATGMAPNFNFAQCMPGIEKGTPTGIIDSRWFVLVIDAIPLLEKSKSLSSAELQSLQTWFKTFLKWLQTSPQGIEEAGRQNNHGTWFAAQAASYAFYTGDKKLTKEIIVKSRQYFDEQIDSAGRQIHELRRTKSYDYSLYNVHALITLARIGDHVSEDLWQYNMTKGNNRNILESIRYLARFAMPGQKWPYPQIAEKAISLGMEDGDHFSVYYPYDMYSALRIAAKVYHDPELVSLMKQLAEKTAQDNRANLLISTEK